ncbi:MAG: nitroreductase family protein [Clostridiales bacterium]|jgi:nitroreductase|nr:nitroreductase family protein [Clostridiales bacterium]
MSVLDVIKTRRSIRKYQSKPVEEEKLLQVLEAGRLAPAANNAQEWKFIAVRDPELIKKLVPACGGQSFVGEAPVVLVICADGEEKIMYCGQPARAIDCSIALSFMILEAAELGLGTCWLGYFSNDKVKRVLNIPADKNVVAVTPLGYANESPAPRPRKSVDEVVAYDGWK